MCALFIRQEAQIDQANLQLLQDGAALFQIGRFALVNSNVESSSFKNKEYLKLLAQLGIAVDGIVKDGHYYLN